jgi:hypothetical protein
MKLPAVRLRGILLKMILDLLIVIPAQAGIQKRINGFRIKCGMTE